MKKSTITKILACTIGLWASHSAHAISLTLGGPLPNFRTATLSDAVAGSGLTGSGNATVTDVENGYGGDWTERGSVEGGTAGPGTISDGMLTVQVLSGNWGSNGPLSGNWTVNDPTFWTSYAQGAISLHVGNGGGEPDHFIWKITPGLFSGTWSYDGTGLNGGGLSNLKLYSEGTGTTVPDGGATMALLGLSLLGMTAVRKAMAQPKA